VLDYPLYFTVNSVFATATGNTKQIEDHYNNIAANYDSSAWYRLVTFLDNHDQPRFLSSANANNNTNRLAVALTFLYTSRGVPCLYYGTEQAFNGSGDPNNREDMFAGQWPTSGPSVGDRFDMTHPLFRHVAMLNNFRRSYIALRRGSHVNLWNNSGGPGLFAYARRFETQEVFVVFNTAASAQTLPSRPSSYSAGTQLVNLLNTNEMIAVDSTTNIPSITVPGTAAKVFVAQSQFQPLDPVVISQTPGHAVSNVPPSTAIVLQFNKPMDTNSVQAAFALQPATAGTFSWNALRDTMTFTPANGGYPGRTTNTITIGTTAHDSVSGTTMFGKFQTYFVTTTNNASSDLVRPTVAISLPLQNDTVAGALNISGIASDNVAVAKVEVLLDNSDWIQATGTTSWSLSFNSANWLNGSHTIAARATDSSGNVSTNFTRMVRFFNIPGGFEVRLSAGNPNNIADCAGNIWLADQAYSVGTFGYVAGTAGYLANAIAGICSNGWPLYQRERYSTSTSSFRYLFDCPVGVYESTLLEAETWTNVPNGRVFNVFIQGQQVLTNFDIYATTGGMNIPVVRVFTNAVANSQLEILFVPVIDNARASGIHVKKIADLDTDGDGIPDWWTLGYFDHPTGQEADASMANDDPDGDGMTNLQEFLAGTDPLDVNSALRITNIEIISNDVQVIWTSMTGKTYLLQRSPVPDSGNWSNVIAMVGIGGISTQTDLGAATNSPPQFYRVRVLP
jgi:hypothetical protein